MSDLCDKVKKDIDKKFLLLLSIAIILESICIIEALNWIFQMHWW